METRCYICGRTQEDLENNETIRHLEYKKGMETSLCCVCQGLMENIAESVVRAHLSTALDSHQELSEFIRSIVESYLYPEPQESY